VTKDAGTAFNVGATSVTCTARMRNVAAASCAFTVTVKPPPARVPGLWRSATHHRRGGLPCNALTPHVTLAESFGVRRPALASDPWTS
jgi:hypothetical protein